MKILRVYIDTSVIGGCFDEKFSLWSNRLIEDFQKGLYKPVVSSVVATEIGLAPVPVRAKFDEILQMEPEFLEMTEEAVALAAVYSEHGALPPKFRNDLLHIALASVANADVLGELELQAHRTIGQNPSL
jgi:hypothetical protein